jgi:tRNA(Ile2) C34 agmatinyltransferase TiaS
MPAQRLFDPSGPTLEDAIVAAWDELTVAGHAPCPVCSAEMSAAGRCDGCGSELA